MIETVIVKLPGVSTGIMGLNFFLLKEKKVAA